MEKYYPMAIGVILDVKLKNFEIVKNYLLESLYEIPVGEDIFYLYHPEEIETIEKKGEQIKKVHSFKQIKINLKEALTQTTYILASEIDEQYRRKVILITDKYNNLYDDQIEILFKINENQRLDCKYYFIGIENQNFGFNHKTFNIKVDEIKTTLNNIFSEEQYEKLEN